MGIDDYGVIGGVDSMVSVRFTPWHGVSDLKKRVEFSIESGRQALTLAGIDWPVVGTSLADLLPDAPLADEHLIVRRTDNGAVLGSHSAGYQIIQNSELGDVTDGIILAVPGAYVESAGALYRGKVTWVLVRLPDSTVVHAGGSEHHERYILVSTSHDGSHKFTIRPTDVRVECMNTISMAWQGNSALYVVGHTTNALEYMAQAKEGLAVALANWKGLDAEIQRLLDTPLSADDFLGAVVPKVIDTRPEDEDRVKQANWDSRFTDIVGAYYEDYNQPIQDTAWGAVNAINEFEVWSTKVRTRTLAESQMERLLSGQFPLTRRALELVGKG